MQWLQACVLIKFGRLLIQFMSSTPPVTDKPDYVFGMIIAKLKQIVGVRVPVGLQSIRH